jgi:hypothetical protein
MEGLLYASMWQLSELNLFGVKTVMLQFSGHTSKRTIVVLGLHVFSCFFSNMNNNI